MRVCCSLYADPIHQGHIEYLTMAKQLAQSDGSEGHLVVIVNNDEQAKLKKGKAFMKDTERVKIISALRVVDSVVLSIDTDRTVCKTLASLEPKPDVFANGGDQTNQSIPEAQICIDNGIELVDGLGEKIQSSSWLTGLKKI